MKKTALFVLSILVLGMVSLCLFMPPAIAAPNLVNYQGTLTDSGGSPVTDPAVSMIFRVFDAASSGTLLWEETQTVDVQNGSYIVLLGEGTPTVGTFNPVLFSSDTRWFEVEVNGEVLTPRMRVTSVAYALQAQEAAHAASSDSAAAAGDADTVDGVHAVDLEESAEIASGIATHAGLSGAHHNKTTTFTELSDTASDAQIPASIARDSELTWGNLSGIPAGFADGVDNEGIASETDPEVGANTTNFVPRWDGSALVSGSIFDNGNIGIATMNPLAKLDVNGDVAAREMISVVNEQGTAWFSATAFGNTSPSHGLFFGRKARSTEASPSAVQTDDRLAAFGGYGYGATGWPAMPRTRARMGIVAAENWTDTAQGTYLEFLTTPIGSTAKSEVMRITDAGYVGIGTTNPDTELEVAGEEPIVVKASGYSDGYSPGVFVGRKARGTMDFPAAVQADDILAAFAGYGYGETGWSPTRTKGRMEIVAAENWTDTAQGAYLNFQTTPVGTTTRTEVVRITDVGDVGIGTTTPTERLTVLGTIESASGGFRFPDGTLQTTAAAGGGGGDITGVTTGTGLSGGGLSGDVTLNADTAYLQRRVSGTCVAGSSISTVNSDGTVLCETDDGITAETDPTVLASVKDGVDWLEVTGRPAGLDDGDDVGIASETDPEVGANTANFVPLWDGSALVSGSIFDNGNIGIGTTNPTTELEVAGEEPIVVFATGYSDAYSPGVFVGRKARGTMDFPAAVQADDILAAFAGYGYGETGWSPTRTKGRMEIVAAENWTDTAQGAYLNFQTTPVGTTDRSEVMRITDAGRVGIGTTNPGTELEVAGKDQNSSIIYSTSYLDELGKASLFVGRKARGTMALPSAVQANDILAGFGGYGYGTTGWPSAPYLRGRMDINASEDWTDTAQGTHITFRTTLSGTTTRTEVMRITDTGDVGVGTITPMGKLDVNGTIYQRGGILHADYVFDPGYMLESIKEHARYMWENKHLKAIPKAAVDKNGLEILEVGAHRRGMVEELEKAHIYIERLHKQIKALEERLAKVEKGLSNGQ